MILNTWEWWAAQGESTGYVYPFSSSDSDYLAIETLTGNIKVMITSRTEDGIHPSIVQGRIGSFVASGDYVSDPVWNRYDADVENLTYIVDGSFTGVVGKYNKNNGSWITMAIGPTEVVPDAFYYNDEAIYYNDQAIIYEEE